MVRKTAPSLSSMASVPSPFSGPNGAAETRIRGTVPKRNVGFLRQWRARQTVVTADGFLKYQKSKGDSVRVKEIDLVKSDISHAVERQSGHFCVEVQCGQKHFWLGFDSKTEAKLWQEVMLEAADENAAGRRAWMAALRQMMTLSLRERRDLVPHLTNRDWIAEWNFCWRAINSTRGEDFNSRRRRLKRMYTLWLQFNIFAETVAEIYFVTAQTRADQGSDLAGEPSRRSPEPEDNQSQQSSGSGTDETSVLSSPRGTGMAFTTSVSDVDEIRLNSILIQYGSKSWRGRRRLEHTISHLAHFRQTLQELVSERGLESAMASFPVFPLVAAFTMRDVPVVVTALDLRDDVEVVPLDRRHLSELLAGVRVAHGLSRFRFRELPDLWVRRQRGGQDATLIEVTSRYEDVLYSSLRSNMVHGILIRAEGHGIEALSSHDVGELVHNQPSRWVPYLDLWSFCVGGNDHAQENRVAKSFLLQPTRSLSYFGDVVIAIDPEVSRLQLDLKEAFVTKYQIDLLPTLRRLEEVKQASVHLVNPNSAVPTSNEAARVAADDLERSLIRLLRRHIQNFARRLVTIGDRLPNESAATRFSIHDRGSVHVRQSTPDLFPNGGFRTSSTSSRRRAIDTGARTGSSAANSLYVIDSHHLRQLMDSHGVNVRFLPMIFGCLVSEHQPGVRILVASEIVARIAKSLFRFRLFYDENVPKNKWKTRKARMIEFIRLIMHGLTINEADTSQVNSPSVQFWRVDAPIWYLLGPMASSFPVAEPGAVLTTSAIDVYRTVIKGNPGVLLSSLLRVFNVHLANTFLPSLHETRFESLPFMQREDCIDFPDETLDSKLAVVMDGAWLKANYECFRHAFGRLKQMFLDGGATISEKSELHSDSVFFGALTRQFRSSLEITFETRLERAIDGLQSKMMIRQYMTDAFGSLMEYRLDKSREFCVLASKAISDLQDCESISLSQKLGLMAMEALSDTGSISPTRGNQSKLWSDLIEWLKFFYRPANTSQFLPRVCPHPVAEAIYAMLGSSFQCSDQTPSEQRVRLRLEEAQRQEMWAEIKPTTSTSIDRQTLGGVTRGFTPNNTMIIQGDRTQSMSHNEMEGLHLTEVMLRSSSDPVLAVGTPLQYEQSIGQCSSRHRLLELIDRYLLSCEISWHLPVVFLRRTEQSFPPIVKIQRSICTPGVPFLWGKSTGLSLDEEAKMASKPVDGISSRPRAVADISIISLPFPVRQVAQVSCGYRHTALVTRDDQLLYTFGYGECGRLGHGDEESIEYPQVVDFFSSLIQTLGVSTAGVRQVSCGREHTMVVLNSGELFGFGWAEAGRLGTGDSGSIVLPSKVTSLDDVTAVACGREHTLALTSRGEVFSFGAGFGGRLGNGQESDEEFPTRVQGLATTPVLAVDAGECHSCAVTTSGEVFTWGFGSSGALGHGVRENALTATRVDGPWCSTKADPVTGVACGSYHTLARTKTGRLFGWGDAAAGQLGDALVDSEDMVVLTPHEIDIRRHTLLHGPGSQTVMSIACGTFTSAACTAEGKLFVWGSAAAGNGAKLDIEDAKVKPVSLLSDFLIDRVSIGAYHTVAITRPASAH